jgi:putative Mg2+ transporter-C (MgtC) family protein
VNHVDLITVAIRLGVALALGSIIGFERQWAQKMAGLRTNALVALGACGFVAFSAIIKPDDPTRIAAQVVTGIGFLGAGIILREGVNVHGLNTAATLWCSSMVGTFAGGGFLIPSVMAAALVVATNLLLRPLARQLNWRALSATHAETYYSVEVTCNSAEEARTRSLLLHALSQSGLGLRRLDSEDIPDTAKVAVKAQVVAATRNDTLLEQIVGRLSLESYVSAVTWRIDRSIPES